MWSTLALLVLTPAEAKPPGVLKMLTARYDPATPARTTLQAMRAQVAANPVDGAIAFGTAAGQVLRLLPVDERAAVVTEAGGYLDAAAGAAPGRVAEVDAARGILLAGAGDPVGAEAALRRSMKAQPTMTALVSLLELVPAEASTLCAGARPALTDVYSLVEVCRSHGDSLAWATPADLAAWKAESARVAAAAAARAAEDQASMATSFSSVAPSPAPVSAPAPAGPTSVSLHSNCGRTVKVFFGDKPGYSSGTSSSVSSNSTSSYSLKPGSLIWITDDSGNPLSSTSVGTSSQRIEIASSCQGFGST